MDELLDFLVNISLIILILGIYAIYKFRKEKKTYWFILSCVSIALFFMAVSIAGDEYGNFYIAIIILIISIAFLTTMLCLGIHKKIKGIISFVMPMAYLLYSVYKRIKYEELQSIDKQTNIVAFFSSIFENEWFKGISIGIISAVVAGIILEKIKKQE